MSAGPTVNSSLTPGIIVVLRQVFSVQGLPDRIVPDDETTLINAE